jgi:hypothetical protein
MILLRFRDDVVSAPHERSHRERIHDCKIARMPTGCDL